jgi:chromate transporter
VCGASFILPAALITGAFAWAYVRFGSLPQAASVLAGIKPAVLAVIAVAIWRLGKTAVKDAGLGLLGALSLAAFLFGLNPILILFGGGLLGMLAKRASSLGSEALFIFVPRKNGFPPSLRVVAYAASGSIAAGALPLRPSIGQIGFFFLKVGAVLYGGGYVLLAFLERGLVQQHAWLTRQQLLDAVVIGQFTPGPVLSTATFIGYILGSGSCGCHHGDIAAVVLLCRATGAGVISVAANSLDRGISGFGECVRRGTHVRGSVRLGTDALRGWPAWLISLGSLAILLRWKISPAWIVLGGGIVGLFLATIR